MTHRDRTEARLGLIKNRPVTGGLFPYPGGVLGSNN